MNTNIHLNRPKWRLAAKHYLIVIKKVTRYGNDKV